MVEKGWVQTRSEGRGFVYEPSRPREAALRSLVRRVIDVAFKGSAEGLVLSLLEGDTLHHEELERVRRLVAEGGPKA